MRNWTLPLIAAAAVTAVPCWAVPEAMTPTPAGAAAAGDQVSTLYNDGLGLVEKADLAIAAIAPEADAKHREEVLAVAREAYSQALAKFQEATQLDPNMPGAWNMLGYSERKLGNYEAALTAYARALTLRPNFPEAIEYRGEAYLGLNRIAEAKQAYLDLFASSRVLADKYMDSIKAWVEQRRKAPAGVPAAEIKQLEKWIKERTKIAATTTALTREAAAGWQ